MGSLSEVFKTEPCACIFRVPQPLRVVNPQAFSPRLVSIGPYHADLSSNGYGCHPPIQDLKEAAVESVKKDMVEEHSLGRLLNEIAQDMDQIKAFYYRSLKTEKMGKDSKDEKQNLAKLFLNDACFVVSMLRSATEQSVTDSLSPDFSYIYKFHLPRAVRHVIIQDMLLMENQIPLFLLLKVIKANCPNGTQAHKILHSIVLYLATHILPIAPTKYLDDDRSKVEFIDSGKHLLDCVYTMVTYKKNELINIHNGIVDTPKLLKAIPSAQELHYAGVKFHVHDKSLADISFDRGVLSLPMVHMSDNVEIIFRNLLAYESHIWDKVVILSYLHLMNDIVGKTDDVGILMHHKIFEGKIRSKEEVSKLWMKLCTSTMRAFTSTHHQASTDVCRYIEKPMHSLTTKLRRAYFTKPWIIIIIFFAFAIFLTTFITMSSTIALLHKD